MFAKTIETISEGVLSQYKTIFNHPTNNGDTREDRVIKFCRKVFPDKYGFANGEVFDIDGNSAGQIDVIIYDKLQSFVFTDGDKILAPIESTYGIIEVKSNLTTSKLDEAIIKLQLFQNLKKEQIEGGVFQVSPYCALGAGKNISIDADCSNMGINVIFAFDTDISEKTIYEKIISSGCVDILIIPGKYFIMGRKHEKFILTSDENSLNFFSIVGEKSVSAGILYLQVLLSKKDLKGVNIEKHFYEHINEIGIHKVILSN